MFYIFGAVLIIVYLVLLFVVWYYLKNDIMKFLFMILLFGGVIQLSGTMIAQHYEKTEIIPVKSRSFINDNMVINDKYIIYKSFIGIKEGDVNTMTHIYHPVCGFFLQDKWYVHIDKKNN